MTRIPLNDDAQEKKGRLHSRKALHEKQINELQAAAATPKKTLVSRLENENASPRSSTKTPRNMGDDDDDFTVAGSGVTPMKRVPILANFEEWMKMATDNKINATNSWNFALIDYFHDMSLLKEGDGVNFQRASCTLDGCVKIYTSRVDSVATETGKLLSGLADSNSKKRDKDEEDGEDSEEEVDENGNVVQKKPRKRVSRSPLLQYWLISYRVTTATIIRGNACAFFCFTAAEEVRARVCCRPIVQEDFRRL